MGNRDRPVGGVRLPYLKQKNNYFKKIFGNMEKNY